MDNKQMDGRTALKTAKDQIFDLLDIAGKEIDALHKVKRSHEETISGDSEFIENLHAQISILNTENYQSKVQCNGKDAEIMDLRLRLVAAEDANNQKIIIIGMFFVGVVLGSVINYFTA